MNRITARARENQCQNSKKATQRRPPTTDTCFEVDYRQTEVAGGDQASKTDRHGTRSGTVTSQVAYGRHAEQPQPESEPQGRAGGPARVGEHRRSSHEGLGYVGRAGERDANQGQKQAARSAPD